MTLSNPSLQELPYWDLGFTQMKKFPLGVELFSHDRFLDQSKINKNEKIKIANC